MNLTGQKPYQKASAQDKKRDELYQEWCRKKPCAKCKSKGEWVPEIGEFRCQYAHATLGGKAAKSMKAILSGLPLCGTCHDIQHQSGHFALAPREWWIETPKAYLGQWVRETAI